MSAIAGVVWHGGAPAEAQAAERMTAAMASRGPDGRDTWARGPAALGHCMLRTTPESLHERQPLANEDGSVIVVLDGRVDDRATLQRELAARGATLRDTTDAELVLRAYEAWGEECADRVIGEFAFVVWDAPRRRLYGARDAAGTRHFYYHQGKGYFGFASEIGGLLALGTIEPRLNEERLLACLVVEFDRDDEVGTLYEGIQRLPAGHSMVVSDGRVRTWRYWEPTRLSEAKYASLDECAEAYLDQLRIVVECRLRHIGPVGAMLSGGLDSSALVGLIRKEFRHRLSTPLRTFSLVRQDRQNCPDAAHIDRMLAEGWVVPTILTSDVAARRWREHVGRIEALNEPWSLTQGFTNGLMYEAAARSGCRVLMDGMANDLYFYAVGRSLGWQSQRLRSLPAVLAASRRHGMEKPVRQLAWRAAADVAPRWVRAEYGALRDRYAKPWSDFALLRREVGRDLLAASRKRRNSGPRDALLLDDRARHARDFTTGLLSFAHEVNGQLALSMGVEPRSPFSDRRMIEFAIRMPLEAKLCCGWYKHLARRALAGILPEEVRWRSDIGRHPGWTFYDTLAREMERGDCEGWSAEGLARKLDPWLDVAHLRRAVERYRQHRDPVIGRDLLAVSVLARWIAPRFNTARERTG
ncbi:MAG: asparagine synthase-related protein [Pseudomonadota bacterium]|nr:asparagine synthase-related protein [Pseudomonadota bacterium]